MTFDCRIQTAIKTMKSQLELRIPAQHATNTTRRNSLRVATANEKRQSNHILTSLCLKCGAQVHTKYEQQRQRQRQ